jgi:hypothetical protein
MTFILHIDLGNDAMQTGLDVANALRGVADKLTDDDLAEADAYDRSGNIRDTNGNKVGNWKVGR